jgi:thiamine-phosphate pyrophosphorylase
MKASTTKKNRLKGLYAITDSILMPDDEQLIAQTELAILGGARIIQYRDKTTDQTKRLRQAAKLAELCHQHEALLLINDDMSLAQASGADGVHLGQADGAVPQARQLLGESAIIGVTCHDRLSLAEQALHEGADYIAFGAFFTSKTKPHASPAPLSLLSDAKQQFDCPIVAIGGITEDNAHQTIAHGANMIAVIHALFTAPNVKQQAQLFTALFAANS